MENDKVAVDHLAKYIEWLSRLLALRHLALPGRPSDEEEETILVHLDEHWIAMTPRQIEQEKEWWISVVGPDGSGYIDCPADTGLVRVKVEANGRASN